MNDPIKLTFNTNLTEEEKSLIKKCLKDTFPGEDGLPLYTLIGEGPRTVVVKCSKTEETL